MSSLTSTSQMTPILINLFAALVGASGQYFYKIGASRLKAVPLYMNWHIVLGAFLFSAVMVLFILAYKLGGRMNVVYPMYATTFIWGAIIGIVVDKEPWASTQLAGVLLVVAGLSVIAYCSPSQ